ncbi:MAG: hypothetical protein RIS28_1041 [Bacteroidota bacterium]|jgi:hypothetical protein
MKSQLKYAVITAFICVSVLMLGSCERINHNQDNNESSAQNYGLLQTELATIMELVDEVSDQTTGKGTPSKFLLQNLSKEAHIIVIDSSYFDGDDIEFVIDFGPVVKPFKPTQKCLDGRFRAGKIHVRIKSHYIENSSESFVFTDANEEYWFGTDGKPSQILDLRMSITRDLKERLMYKNVKFKVKQGEVESEFEGNLVLEKIAGIQTPGIMGDHYLLTGQGQIEHLDEEFDWRIVAPLKKKIEPGCGMIPVLGEVLLENERTNKNISLDFDPFKNESCDRIVRATIAEEMIDFVLE